MVSGGANGYYTLLKGDPEVVVTKGNLIIPRRNSTTGRSFMSYPGQIIIIIIIIISINFINMSMSALGVLESSCDSLFRLLKSLDLPEMHQRRLVSKTIAIAIRSTYYIFCRRNKDWTDPDLMDF